MRDLGSFQVAPRPPRKEPPPRKPRYNGADHRKYVEEEEDLKLLERIKAMRDLGVSHFQAEKQTGINRTTIRRIVQKYSLDYPAAAGRNEAPANARSPRQTTATHSLAAQRLHGADKWP
ncbi:hypothetical protein [Pseudomonas sp. B20]|uniref:hypothetical protein n=1 Tax=Pseudomonas sp. B20 TaxID=129268 RepID=UPI001CF994E7|nr:hypothetical protein [Pseudomonas sp. B20]